MEKNFEISSITHKINKTNGPLEAVAMKVDKRSWDAEAKTKRKSLAGCGGGPKIDPEVCFDYVFNGGIKTVQEGNEDNSPTQKELANMKNELDRKQELQDENTILARIATLEQESQAVRNELHNMKKKRNEEDS